jgi:heptosyltransferase-2
MLLRTPNWLGDGVMALESILGVVSSRPDTVLWCHPRVAGLYRHFLPGTRIIPLGDPIPRGRFGTLLLMTDSLHSALLGVRTGAPERIGYGGAGRDSLLTLSLPPGESRLRHHCLHYEALAGAAGFSPACIPTEIPILGETLAVFPGAAYGGAKRWTGFPEAVRMTGIGAVFYGNFRERDSLEAMARECGGEAQWSLSIPELAGRLSRSRACLGNDSGGVHLAAALGIPTAAVFCSTSPAWTAPRGPRVRVVSAGAPCSPCFRRECPRGNPVCMSGISPEAVAKEVLDV